ncbi:hypothetical protein RhiJN_08901 [Ceratobasidium sp. AG-Ba]|nr:hypothetical protein RhiJN_08901 [Ceratobasidium sp. AG-Ba]
MSPSKPTKGKSKARPTDASNNDNSAGASRKRKESSRAREGRENAAEVSAVHAGKRLAQKERREERRLERIEDMLVEQEGETQREAQYREFALMMQAQNDEMALRISRIEANRAQQQQALAENSTPGASGSSSRRLDAVSGDSNPSAAHPPATTRTAPLPMPAPGSVAPPERLSDVTMTKIRQDLGLADDTTRWFEIRAHVRDFMAMAALNLDEPWKHQNKTRLGNLYELILQRIPEFGRFLNNWAAEIIVRDVFNHRRTFRNSKKPGWKGKRKRRDTAKDANKPSHSPGSESGRSQSSATPRSRSATPGSDDDMPSHPTSPARSPSPYGEPTANSRASTPDAGRSSRSPPRSSSPLPKTPGANQRKRATNDENDEAETTNQGAPHDSGADIEMSNFTPRRSERHTAALAAAAAAAEDDQRAATRERAKKAGGGRGRGRGKGRGRGTPNKATGTRANGKGKGKKRAAEEDQDNEDQELFPEEPELCEW